MLAWAVPRHGVGRLAALLVAIAFIGVGFISQPAHAAGLEPIKVDTTTERIEITAGENFARRRGEQIQVETAPDMDGAVGRMTVTPALTGANPDWLVFALRNVAERRLTFWVTAERYTLIGSGITWPDLDARRIEAMTPSLGFIPERVASDRADIFELTIDPGETVTYAVELSAARSAPVYLWQPTSYRLKIRDRQLFNGIMLGIAGLLGVFLTAVFAANHNLIFPTAAFVAWSALAYLCVDFGFWHKLFQVRAEDNAVYRAATEAALAASLLLFLYTFLRLGSWHSFVRMVFSVWIIAQLALIPIAIVDPTLSATFARLSFAGIAGIGALVMVFLALRGQDRALSLLPAWIMLGVWVFGAALTLSGRLQGDLVVSALVAGLVIVLVLLGFTVTQVAFRTYEPAYAGGSDDQSARALAVEGAGAAVWEWQARRDEISVSPIVEAMLGLDPGVLSTKLPAFCAHMHPADRERFHAALAVVREKNEGTIRIDVRLKHADNFYRWFNLEAASVPTTDRRNLRCCGLMRDITEERRAQELLLHDAVHDGLTGLPNRELFIDRLDVDLNRERVSQTTPPAVILIDIDKFRSVNASYGFVIGDSLLLTIARRLKTHLEPTDTIARLGGNQFGIIVHDDDPRQLAILAEEVRRSIRAPIEVGGQEIVLTGALGIAIGDVGAVDARGVLKDAEVAMYRAKRNGRDQVEIFRPEMRGPGDDRHRLENDLRQALAKGDLKVAYQPIVSLAREELAGFEALVRWQHPQLGQLSPADFVPIAEDSDLIGKLGAYVLRQAAKEGERWQKALPRSDNPLFVSVNVSSRQLLRRELSSEVARVLGDTALPRGALRLEITESMVMENPEQANGMLAELCDAGAGLALDDFGTGYSSLAYLQRFPFDTIKIDRELVHAAADDEKGGAIVRSIVALAHELGKKIVAEGVETQGDAAFLRSLGCEFAQGFYYGEAMTPREVADLLKVVRKAERRFQRRLFAGGGTSQPAARAGANGAAPASALPPPDAARGHGAGASSGARAHAGTQGTLQDAGASKAADPAKANEAASPGTEAARKAREAAEAAKRDLAKLRTRDTSQSQAQAQAQAQASGGSEPKAKGKPVAVAANPAPSATPTARPAPPAGGGRDRAAQNAKSGRLSVPPQPSAGEAPAQPHKPPTHQPPARPRTQPPSQPAAKTPNRSPSAPPPEAPADRPTAPPQTVQPAAVNAPSATQQSRSQAPPTDAPPARAHTPPTPPPTPPHGGRDTASVVGSRSGEDPPTIPLHARRPTAVPPARRDAEPAGRGVQQAARTPSKAPPPVPPGLDRAAASPPPPPSRSPIPLGGPHRVEAGAPPLSRRAAGAASERAPRDDIERADDALIASLASHSDGPPPQPVPRTQDGDALSAETGPIVDRSGDEEAIVAALSDTVGPPESAARRDQSRAPEGKSIETKPTDTKPTDTRRTDAVRSDTAAEARDANGPAPGRDAAVAPDSVMAATPSVDAAAGATAMRQPQPEPKPKPEPELQPQPAPPPRAERVARPARDGDAATARGDAETAIADASIDDASMDDASIIHQSGVERDAAPRPDRAADDQGAQGPGRDEADQPAEPNDGFGAQNLRTLPPGIAASLARLAGIDYAPDAQSGKENAGDKVSTNGADARDGADADATDDGAAGDQDTHASGRARASDDALLDRFRNSS